MGHIYGRVSTLNFTLGISWGRTVHVVPFHWPCLDTIATIDTVHMGGRENPRVCEERERERKRRGRRRRSRRRKKNERRKQVRRYPRKRRTVECVRVTKEEDKRGPEHGKEERKRAKPSREKSAPKTTSRAGFEPTRAVPNGFQVHRLNLSATVTSTLYMSQLTYLNPQLVRNAEIGTHSYSTTHSIWPSSRLAFTPDFLLIKTLV